ncbi:MAG: TOTE conflict system archaeo-eukaryotic primase domain-containing protein [Gammaproteobacteria bacterium]
MDWIDHYISLFVGRPGDHSVQLETGNYARADRPLDRARVQAHLKGEVSLATYLLEFDNTCTFAVFDADEESGFSLLVEVQEHLLTYGLPSHLERSRRGGHLWVFFDQPYLALDVRTRLKPFCPKGVEFFPKQSTCEGVGSAIRLPFGIHRRSGMRYPFVARAGGGQWHAIGYRASEQIEALYASPRALLTCLPEPRNVTAIDTEREPLSKNARLAGKVANVHIPTPYRSIRDWNATYDHEAVNLLAGYVDLDARNGGRCPFGWHHAGGHDDHSFQVYAPKQPGGFCWWCHTWQHGGSLFDFLRYWHGIEPKELWRRILAGGHVW